MAAVALNATQGQTNTIEAKAPAASAATSANNTTALALLPPPSTAAGANSSNSGQQLTRPVWWFAPFFSGSGYSSEAVNYVLSLQREGLVAPGKLWITHHGDEWRQHVQDAMSPADRADLQVRC